MNRPDAVLVTIGSWEFQCCAPPVVVGELTTWTLTLHVDTTLDDALRTSVAWHVDTWPASGGALRRLDRGGLSALSIGEPAPLPGRHVVQGRLFGTCHGGSPHDGFPTSTALVRRLWLLGRTLGPASRTNLTPISRSPTEWADDEHGVLLELS